MAAKRHTTHSASKSRASSSAHQEDVRRCRQTMRLLAGVLGARLPVPPSALQPVLLMHFHRAAQNIPTRGRATLSLGDLSGILNPSGRR